VKHSDIIKKHRARLRKLAQVAPALSVEVVADASPVWTGAFMDSINLSPNSINKSFKVYGDEKVSISVEIQKLEDAKLRAKKNSKRIKLGNDTYVTDSVHHNKIVEYKLGYRPFGLAVNAWQNTVNEAVRVVSA